MPKKKRRKRKIETYTANADTYQVEDEDGEMFAPYEGEVVLRKDFHWRQTRLAARDLMVDYCPEIIKVYKRQIVSWTLTEEGDDERLPLPAPGTPEFEDFLWDCDDDFRTWLNSKIAERSDLPNA